MRCLAMVLMLPLVLCGQAAQPVRVMDGERLTLTGTLLMRPDGRLQFVTVKTAGAYMPVFAGYGKEKAHDGKPVHEIALAGYRDYPLLYRHRGGNVTVSGIVATDDASPYYRDGMRLRVTRILTRSGENLVGSDAIAYREVRETGPYHAAVILPGNLAAPWRYRVEGRADIAGPLQCSSNGGGDVVNCTCAKGFHPVSASSSFKGDEARIRLMDDAAQFDVGDDARAVTLRVTCSR